MNSNLTFRPSREDEIPRIVEIIRQAQAQMKALGSRQWQDGYPAEADIRRDLRCGYGQVLATADRVIAYGAVVYDGEAAYEALQGEWLTSGDYATLHRLAVADEAKRQGVAAEFLRRTIAQAHTRGVGSLRVDTNFDNHYMLRLLDRLGFVYCGKVHYASGERLAFERLTEQKQ